MAKSPAFQWYPKDCDTDENVRAMDDAEFGFYVRCLNHAWINNGLPTDIAEFARIMHKTPRQFLKLWARVSRCFFENSEKKFVNFRQEQQRQEQENFKNSRVAAIKSRWSNKSSIHVNAKTDTELIHVNYSASASASATATKTKDQSQSLCPPAAAVEPETPEPPAVIPEKAKRQTPMGTRLQVMSLPDEWRDWAVLEMNWSPSFVTQLFERFSDHWLAAIGAKARKADWFATWRNWCRNEPDRDGLRKRERRPERRLPESMQPRLKLDDSQFISGAELIAQMEREEREAR